MLCIRQQRWLAAAMSVHLQPAEKPITEDDATLARMLEHASVPTLMMSIVRRPAIRACCTAAIRPKKPMINEYHGGLTAEENARGARRSTRRLKAYRDRGCTLPPPPSRDTVRR
jgi:4-hydroxyacetophenone monooxygenase